MNIGSRNEMPSGFIRRVWTAISAFLRDLDSEYSETDYIHERISRLEHDFVEFKRRLSEKEVASPPGGPSLRDLREET